MSSIRVVCADISFNSSMKKVKVLPVSNEGNFKTKSKNTAAADATDCEIKNTKK